VEFHKTVDARTLKLALCRIMEVNWIIVAYSDNGEPEKKK